MAEMSKMLYNICIPFMFLHPVYGRFIVAHIYIYMFISNHEIIQKYNRTYKI